MKSSKAKAYHLTAATAQHYPANAYTHVDLRLPLHAKSRGRRRIDPLAGVWDDEVVPMLRVAPGLRPIVAFRKISHCHPEIGPGIRRTLERRIRLWQGLNDPSPEMTFLRGPSPDQRVLTPRLVSDLLRSAHQGMLKLSDLPVQAKTHASIFNIIKSCKSGTLAQRNKALLTLAVVCNLPLCHLAKYPIASTASLYRWKTIFVTSGFDGLMQKRSRDKLRFKESDVTSAIFKILHEPPKLHGFARTNWRQIDLRSALKRNGTAVSVWTIRRAIRASKYQWRKAKVVLTSNDPDYRRKVQRIKHILSELSNDECFFSVDEYGPFTVRFMPGKKLCAPNEVPSVPQWQKGRGTIIITGALELRTNQITHFYSERKNTDEMIKMVNILRRQYGSKKKIYISWDAAGWHISKALGKHVEFLNGWAEHERAPIIELAPLPSRAQFLNVIESVFSGMSRAIIHNSNFENSSEASDSIDRYFLNRNEFYKIHPKRAGRKIWQHETCEAVFQEENNCKDPRYR
jgi:DDE superfamily endonuclease